MAREKGIFQVSANYEPLKAAPFDARTLVAFKSDLTTEVTWVNDGIAWVYAGMLVVVHKDPDIRNNGLYILQSAEKYTDEESWLKLADITLIDELEKRIDNIEITGSDIEVESFDQLPAEGRSGATYYIKDTHDIYRWDSAIKSYINYSGLQTEDTIIIYGGDSNVNSTET